jgi:hypothetical protein
MHVRRKSFTFRVFSFALPFLFIFTAATVLVTAVHAGNKGAPAFGREIIVDNQRVTGEPSISIDGQDRIYVSTPYGFLTTAASFGGLWITE